MAMAGSKYIRGRWLLIPVVGLIAYWNSLSGVFLLDDFGEIVDNPSIREALPLSRHLEGTRPVVHLSFAVNYAIGGLNPRGYHVVNVIVHLLAGLALYGVIRRSAVRFVSEKSKTADRLALSIALIWMVHPLQTQAVTYVVQRAESMMGLFYLLTIYCAVRGMGSAKATVWYIAAVASCALGMGCKEVMVTAPVMVFLIDGVMESRSWAGALRRRWGLYLALAATWIVPASFGVFQGLATSSADEPASVGFAIRGVTPAQYALTQAGVLLHYLRLAVWPHPLCFDYAWPTVGRWSEAWLPSVVVLAGVVATGVMLARRHILGLIGAWFFLILAPTSSFVPIKDVIFEHRMYLPLAAIVILGVVVIRRGLGTWSSRATWPAAGVTAVIVVALMLTTIVRNRDYQSPAALWSSVTQVSPRNARAWNDLGVALSVEGRWAEAVEAYQRAIEARPDRAATRVNLGRTLLKMGRMEEAEAELRAAVRQSPENVLARHTLALALERSGRFQEAIGEYQQVLRLNPDHPDERYNLAQAWVRIGGWNEAGALLTEQLRRRPDDADAHFLMGVVWQKLGRSQEAEAAWREAVRVRPELAEAVRAQVKS